MQGYRNFTLQKAVRSQCNGVYTQVNRARAVQIVRDVVRAFINEVRDVTVRSIFLDLEYGPLSFQVKGQAPDGVAFRFGPGFIELEHLVLLELRRVSVGSFQPILAVCYGNMIAQSE